MHDRAVVDVLVEDDRWNVDALSVALSRAVEAAIAAEAKKGGPFRMTVLLTDDTAQRALNARHRGIDRTTDVLSFPSHPAARAGTALTGEAEPLGDISLAYETVAADADAEDVTLVDHAVHLTVHGTLHLLGHTHDADDDASAMEAAETRVLAGLGIADPYA